MAENVKVIVRCRPMSEKERNMKCKVCLELRSIVVKLSTFILNGCKCYVLRQLDSLEWNFSHLLTHQNIVKVNNCLVSIQNPADLTAPSKEFTFDSAYDAKSTTENIYNDICFPLVEVSTNPFVLFMTARFLPSFRKKFNFLQINVSTWMNLTQI